MSQHPDHEARRREYTSAGGVRIRRTDRPECYENAMDALVESLDAGRGVALASSFEYPGRGPPEAGSISSTCSKPPALQSAFT